MSRLIKKVLRILGWILLIEFIGFSIYDGYMYDKVYQYGSAPFYLYILIRFISCAIPGMLCLLGSHIIKN